MPFYTPLLTWIIVSMLSGLLVINSERIICHMANYKKTKRHLHEKNTLRLGGFIIIIGMITWSYLQNLSLGKEFLALQYLKVFFLSIIPLLILTTLEDLHVNTSPKQRLLLSLISAIAIYCFLPQELLEGLGKQSNIMIIFTMIIITTTMIQATNLIDGANGIVLLNAIMVLLVLYFLASRFEDSSMTDLSTSALMTIIFFLPWNYPFAQLFCGDTGAYSIGAFLSFLSALLYLKHSTINLALLITIFSYPLYEITFTVLRRLCRKQPLFKADHEHLHHLLFRLLKSKKENKQQRTINNLLAPAILSIQLPALVACTFFFHSFIILSSVFIITYLIYTFVYVLLLSRERRILKTRLNNK